MAKKGLLDELKSAQKKEQEAQSDLKQVLKKLAGLKAGLKTSSGSIAEAQQDLKGAGK